MQSTGDNVVTHIFMFEPCEDFYFSQSTLTICLMLEWADLLNGDLYV